MNRKTRMIIVSAMFFIGIEIVAMKSTGIVEVNRCTEEQVNLYLKAAGISQSLELAKKLDFDNVARNRENYLKIAGDDPDKQKIVNDYYLEVEKRLVDRQALTTKLISEMMTREELSELIKFLESDVGKKSLVFNEKLQGKFIEASQGLKIFIAEETEKLLSKLK